MSEVEDAKVGTAMAVPPCSAQVADGSCFHLTILFQSGGAATPGQSSVGTSEVVRWLPYGVVIATSHMGDLTVLSLGGL